MIFSVTEMNNEKWFAALLQGKRNGITNIGIHIYRISLNWSQLISLSNILINGSAFITRSLK
jgi:hypothetical protein